MDKLKKHILFILLISILLCSVQAIAAADISDANGNDVFDLSNDIETVEADSIDDDSVVSQDVLKAPSSDEVLRAEPDGSFYDLQTRINSDSGSNPTIVLDRNYVYNSSSSRDRQLITGIPINKNIIIDGNGYTIDGKSLARLFTISSGYTVTLKNLNLINGLAQHSNRNYYGGAIYAGSRNANVGLTIDNCTFENNVANKNSRNGYGGAIHFNSENANSYLIIKNSTFVNNSAYYGGAVYAKKFNITDSNFTKNNAVSGSAIYALGSTYSFIKSISNTTILENRANAYDLTINRLNLDQWTGEFDGFYGTFTGWDNLINGIYLNSGTITMTKVTYYNGTEAKTPETSTTYSASQLNQAEAGIPIHLIITNDDGDIVRDITVYTNSSGGYVVTEEQLQLDYGRYSAYVIHYEDAYYTQIREADSGSFYSRMYTTKITNATVEGYAGETATVTFTVTRTRDGSAVQSGKVIVNINGQNYTANVNSQGRATVTITLPEEGGDFTVTYDGTDTSNWNATGTLKVIIKEPVETQITVTPQNIQVGTDETITFGVTPTDITGTTVHVVIVDAEGVEKYNEDVAFTGLAAGSVTVPNLPAGTYTVTVSYAGDVGHTSAEASANFIVFKNASVVTVTPQNISVGTDEVISFTVTEGATGNVTITITGDALAQPIVKDVPIVNGSITISDLAPGAYTVEVVYGGDENFNASSASAPFTVGQLTPTVTVDTTDITYPETENLDITVTGDGPVPTGTVNVTITDSEGHEIQSINNTIINNGIVVISVTDLAAGDYNVTVIYSGDVNYTVATGNGTFRVKKAVPEVIVDAGDISYPGDETIEIIVSGVSGGAVPSGNVTVTVTDGSGAVVKTFTEEALVDGKVTVSVSGLAAGDYSVAVTYNGDVNYTSAEDDDVFTVGQATPSVTVDAGDVTYPGDETIEIIVSGVSGGAVPSGNVTVTVTDGSGAVVKTFTEEALVDGKVTVSVSGLAAGDYSVAVTYNGDVNYTEATGEGAFTVKKAVPEVIVDASDITVQSTENIVITVSGAGAVPSGNVTVIITDEDGNVIETVDGAVLSDGTVTVPIEGLAAGKYNVSVTYNGDVNYTSASDNANFEVLKHNVTIEVVTAVIGYTGETIQVVIKLTDETGADVINGTVDYIIDFDNRISSLLGASNVIVLTASQDVSNGTANVPVELSAAAGVYPATVSYKGNELYNDAQTSDEAIIKALDTSIESDDISGTIGDKVTVTADIKDKDDNPVKNGTAVLIIDGKKYTAEVKDGKATFDNVELPSKNTTAIIEYLGNDYYNASSITVDVTVNEENQNKTENNTENNTEDNTGDNTQEVASKSVELLATGNPIAMLVLVLLTLVSTISIRRQK